MSEIKVVPGSLDVTESHSISFSVELGLGLAGNCRVYSGAHRVTGVPGRHWIEIQDVEWEFSVAGKPAKYSGVQELYEKIFGEKSFVEMLRRHSQFCEEEVLKGKVLNLLTPDTLSWDELELAMENYIEDNPRSVVSYNDVRYTTDYTLKSLAKIYNKKQPFDHLKVNIFTTKALPQVHQVRNPESLQRWKENPHKPNIEAVSLQVFVRNKGTRVVTPLRK